MLNIATEETYQDGQIIFEEGSSGDWVYLIQSGKVEISKKVGGKRIIVEVLEEGEIIGELGFIAKTSRSASARAVGETTLGIIDRNLLDEEFNKLSGSFRKILMSIVTRFKKLSENANFGRVEPRVAKVLNVVYKDKGGFVSAYTENVSGSGMFVKTQKPLEKGESFLLKLSMPDLAEPLKVTCEVAWSRKETDNPARRPMGMGVRFVQISQDDDVKLRKILRDSS